MKLWIPFALGATGLITVASLIAPDWDLPPIDTIQTGYRGTGMATVLDRETQVALREANVPPESPYEPDPEGDRAGDIYENVQVLGDLSDDQFNHLMASITEWVSPEEGCNYCHNPANLASDDIYTKVVSRRMFQMTQNINAQWSDHVGGAGVNCYTCHRGNNVPEYIWFESHDAQKYFVGWNNGQNRPGYDVAIRPCRSSHSQRISRLRMTWRQESPAMIRMRVANQVRHLR